jgi:hypothetical protein
MRAPSISCPHGARIFPEALVRRLYTVIIESFARVVVGVLVSVAAVGCAPADVTGDWEGHWRVDWGLGEGDITLSLTQTDDHISGSYDVDGSICAEQGDVDGSVDRESVRLTLTAIGGGRVEIHGSLSPGGDHIEGDFDVSEGWCGFGAEGEVDLDKR